MIATATTAKTIEALRTAGFEVTEKPAYGQTVEFWCYRKTGDVQGWLGCVLVVKGDQIIGYAIDMTDQDGPCDGWIDPTDVAKVPGRTIFRPHM